MAFSLQQRVCGLLLHPTSLPGPHGCGDLGPEAHRFAEWAASAGQAIWQMLPVVPPAGGASPYQSNSAFAGNPSLVSLEGLRDEGWLRDEDLVAPAELGGERVDFAATEAFRRERLRRAFDAFRQQPPPEFFAYCERERGWLDDFALYCALKEAHGGGSWSKWPWPLRAREPAALAQAAEEQKGEMRYHQFVQYVFDRQWSALRRRCAELGVALVGDIPIFVGHDSADVWQNPSLFFLDDQGEPSVVAGVPPDYFSETGQRWGNVLYRWDVHRERGYGWWIARFRAMLDRFDAVRVDHFIGFHRYWEIDADSPTAVQGRYRPGPGADFFAAVEHALGPMPIIAEDLGVVTPEVDALRARFRFPGMKVTQFSFGPDAPEQHPHLFPKDSVVYTGTHDNDTTRGWYDDLTRRAASDPKIARELSLVQRYLPTDGREIHWDLVRQVLRSASDLAILPVQDLLGLDTHSRMNTPGLAEGNWSFRLRAGALDAPLAARLRELVGVYSRVPAVP